MKLLVGLGNPGGKYEKNRHNVGFMALDRIADTYRCPAFRRRFQGVTSEGEIAGERVVLLKPETYMNESGRAVGEAARFLKIPLADIIVLYDEIDLAPGKLKVKTGGGNAGHNGLRSITQHVGNDYRRVRIGVGHPGVKDLVAGYVLHDFAKAEVEGWLDPLLAAIAKHAGLMVKGDEARFLSAVGHEIGAEPDKPARIEKPSTEVPRPSRPSGGHPSGNRSAKRQSAIAENLARWMKAREDKSEGD
ncbi:MAG: aminoacyl-tRNA hydrolase [Hyphomicrobiaceae bacterium]|nr:aminoacyl-tRNA hydrolase [Hyphomicrobiaceae bacterium]